MLNQPRRPPWINVFFLSWEFLTCPRGENFADFLWCIGSEWYLLQQHLDNRKRLVWHILFSESLKRGINRSELSTLNHSNKKFPKKYHSQCVRWHNGCITKEEILCLCLCVRKALDMTQWRDMNRRIPLASQMLTRWSI